MPPVTSCYVHSLDRAWCDPGRRLRRQDLDRTKWRVWQENAERTTVCQENGRLSLTARGPIGHNGLWGLTTAKYKDVVLVGEMDIRSQGSSPHRLALHLCGGDG